MTVQKFGCFTSAFIHPNDNNQYLLAGTTHGQLLAWCIKLDSFVLNIVDQRKKQMSLNDSIAKSNVFLRMIYIYMRIIISLGGSWR